MGTKEPLRLVCELIFVPQLLKHGLPLIGVAVTKENFLAHRGRNGLLGFLILFTVGHFSLSGALIILLG